MFELPDSKRVRREDLYSTSSRETTPGRGTDADDDTAAIRARLNAQIASRLLFLESPDDPLISDEPATATATDHAHAHAQPAVLAPAAEPPEQGDRPPSSTSPSSSSSSKSHHAAEWGPRLDDSSSTCRPREFQFRLFSSSAPGEKVILSPDGVIGGGSGAHGGGGIVSGRPVSHYVRGELTAEQRGRFGVAAVSGAQVLTRARARAWGLEVPWRVTRIAVTVAEGNRLFEYAGGHRMMGLGLLEARSPAAQSCGPGGKRAATATTTGKTKKARPSKKQRTTLRIRDRARKQREAEAEADKITREEHVREKKKRLNREKKLKRKQKAMDEKASKGSGEAGTSAQSPTTSVVGQPG